MRTSIAFLCCSSLFLVAQVSRAEFILDDFDVSAEVFSPGMFDKYIDTPNVGPLGATRSIRIGGGQGRPDGFLDSNISQSSTLTGQITNLNPFPSGATLVAIQSNYQFSPVDFTQHGTNNAFFFDFLQVTSELPPSFFLILLSDGQDNFAHFEFAFPLNADPFTLIVPFDQFPPRGGGGASRPDYTTIRSINLELRASEVAGGGPDPLNFFMQLDRIRVGRVVPEPSTRWLSAIGVSLVTMKILRILR